jgi:hypothetical protein
MPRDEHDRPRHVVVPQAFRNKFVDDRQPGRVHAH